MGLKEAPSITYISEICEPSIRGTLFIIAVLLHQFGSFLVFGLGSIVPWRIVAFLSAVIPLASFATVIFVSKSFRFKFLQTSNRSYVSHSLAPRVASMVTVTKSCERCRKITSMVAWLDDPTIN